MISIILAVIALIPNNVLADGPSYDITNYDMDAYIQEDGTIHIDESITYYFSSSANGLTRDLRYFYKTNKDSMEPNSARYQATGIENITVAVTNPANITTNFTKASNAEKGDNGVYTVDAVNADRTDGYDIMVYSPISSNNFQTVHYSYDITDAVVQYNDMSEIYYNFIGNGIETDVDEFNLDIYLPKSINMDDVKYYPHTYATKLEDIQVMLDSASNCISFNIRNIPSGKPVDARIVFPNTVLMNCTKKYNNDYDFNSLYKIENSMSLGNTRYFIHITINIILGVLLVALCIIFLTYGTIKSRKFRTTVKNANYFRDIPKRLNLLEYQALLPSKITDALSSNLIIATILDLTNRKILNLETKKDTNKKKQSDYEYNVSINKNAYFTKLYSYEEQILSLIFSDQISTDFNVSDYTEKTVELNARFKEISKNSKLVQQISKASSKRLIDTKKIYEKVKTSLILNFIILIVTLFIVFLFNTLVMNPDKALGIIEFIISSVFTALFSFVVVAILYDLYKIPTNKYAQDQKEVLGLWKYLKDYSLIKDRYPIELSIWNEYLVFASLFGIADKVAKEFKEELIKAGYSDDQIYLTYPVLCMSSYSSSFTTSINSSTGYSGSGSGGGGGRRRGSRCFLIHYYLIFNIHKSPLSY
jgi:uncharacterized membrane protein